jgi:metal-responsive CopG/Arc/MetJ family transcriptional regulator
MRTTIDLPEPLLDEVQAVTQASTRREALVIALEDYLRRQKLRAVISAAGDLDLELDVRALREADRRRSRG